MKIKTLLIDDEELARLLLKKFIETETDFDVIGEASDGFEGAKLIQNLKPDLIILDIQMPKLTGLEMVEILDNPPQIIFATAYDQFAIQAFEKNAIDYLLKPFSKDRLLKALEKAKEKINNNYNPTEDVKTLIRDSSKSENILNRIVVKNGSKIEMIPYEELCYVASDGDYVKLHCTKGTFLKQQTMMELEGLLSPGFLRIHRSYLVNSSFIQKLELYEKHSYRVLLKNGDKLTVSKAGYKLLKETLGW